jgi:3-oxoacyl-[acyl-carrier-protein] synthase-3
LIIAITAKNMNKNIRSVITGTGSYIPSQRVVNTDFLDRNFLDRNGSQYDKSNEEIIKKFAKITGIEERRYAANDVLASDMGAEAGKKALKSAGLEGNELDYIIVAHNFGDVKADNSQVDMVPSLASRIKHKLGITNSKCVPYDLPFGCPGWLQGLIQGHYYLKSGEASACLVIGTETLSRVCDPHDRDSMIYADGAGAAVLQSRESKMDVGVLSHITRTDTQEQVNFLRMEPSYNPACKDILYLKMDGRKLYQYALTQVPGVVKASLEKAGISIGDVQKLLIHQANAKMDTAILQRFAKLYNCQEIPDNFMPMTISWLGNSSVATIPTMLDLILRDEMDGHQINKDDIIVFSSVGAGMNINSVVYKMC